MPPRLHRTALPPPLTPSTCPNARPHNQLQIPPYRQFSDTPRPQVTLRRRAFYAWLNGPGKQVKEPLPGSTNYLGGYDRDGNLVRAGPKYSREAAKEKWEEAQGVRISIIKAAKEKKEGEGTVEAEPESAAVEGQEDAEKTDEAVLSKSSESKNTGDNLKADPDDEETKLPPETVDDLRPFPQNPHFYSQPVLSEELREAIYQRVKKDGATVPLASVEFGVSNERVGAVVRLKQMEKEWIAQGKPLATPYSKSILSMLPTTPHVPAPRRPTPHEPINDLPVHPATRTQLFVPVSESRHYTRADAGEAFMRGLLGADDRVPHPQLVLAEREAKMGLSFAERTARAQARMAAEQAAKEKEEEERRAEENRKRVIPGRRWDFVVRDVSVEDAGRDGRGSAAAGWRYGVPHQDRKKGVVKIPTSVAA